MIDFKTPLGKGIDITIIFLNLLLVAIFVIDTYNISSSLREQLWKLEILIVAIFIVEYFLRLYGAPQPIVLCQGHLQHHRPGGHNAHPHTAGSSSCLLHL